MTTTAAPASYRLDPVIDAPLVGPRVLALVGDDSGCSLWRAWQPIRHLRLHGYPCDWVAARDPAFVDVPFDYQALLLCRQAWGREDRRGPRGAKKTLKRWKEAGLKLFFEADDDLFTPFVTEQQLRRIHPEKTRAELEADRADALWVLAHCDGVTVSTQYLASTTRRFTAAPVEVIPNAIDAEWFIRRQEGVPRPVPGVTIGWAGGNRPDTDLSEMAIAWGRIARRYPDVTFVVAGHDPPVIREHVPPERLLRLPWVPVEDYPRSLVGIDVGCCPLEDTPFNRSKTPIKAWEYALSGAAVVASPTVYEKVIKDEVNGFLAANANAWESCLEWMLHKPAWRAMAAENLKRDVLERWSLRKNYWRWPAAWHRLMEG